MKKIFTLFSVFILMAMSVCMTACKPDRFVSRKFGLIDASSKWIESEIDWFYNDDEDYSEAEYREYEIHFTASNSYAILDKENIRFVCTTKEGDFIFNDSQSKEITLRPDEKAYWRHDCPVKENFQDCIKVVVTENEHIIGYIIFIIQARWGHEFVSYPLGKAYYPKVDGEYQNVTQKQIEKILETVWKLKEDVA